jgi:glycosyltransferase involved in cell wall biosynthesis
MPSIKISVVIPTYNRLYYLKDCLNSLVRQTYNKELFEVIVINDGSSDSTEHFLKEFKEKVEINFNYITHTNRGVSFSRNVGIYYSMGEYVAFTDDDCIVPEDWLLRIDQLFDSVGGNIAGIGGPLDCITEDRKFFVSKFIQYIDEFNYIPVMGRYFIYPVHISRLKGDEQIPYLRTSNAIFRKSCLKEIGGFDVDFKKPGGEDPDLCYRLLNLNYSFYFDKKLVVLHRSRESFSCYFRSLKSYLEGEIRKSRKRKLYKYKVIRRSYRFVPGQKIISLLLYCLSYPISVIKISNKKEYSLFHKILFPQIIILSKIYALIISSYYNIKYLIKRG